MTSDNASEPSATNGCLSMCVVLTSSFELRDYNDSSSEECCVHDVH